MRGGFFFADLKEKTLPMSSAVIIKDVHPARDIPEKRSAGAVFTANSMQETETWTIIMAG